MSEFFVDWTSPHTEHWEKHLGRFKGKPGIAALEIGVLEGRSTLWFCDNILTGDGSTIQCVDPFLQTHHAGFVMKRDGIDDARMRFKANTERAAAKIKLFAGPSIAYFSSLGRAAEQFDFVYVDGSHTLVDAATDLFWAWGLTKPGGVIVVDDYEYTDVIDLGGGDKILPGVTEACAALLAAAGPEAEVLHKGKQLILSKANPH